jgi:hypothetical protein
MQRLNAHTSLNAQKHSLQTWQNCKGPWVLLFTWLCFRGALFLGPGFRVTRNKLTFRDNLALLLESASPTDRQLEKRFKEWLAKCHKELDRTIKFEALCSQAIQVGGPA